MIIVSAVLIITTMITCLINEQNNYVCVPIGRNDFLTNIVKNKNNKIKLINLVSPVLL